MPETGVSDSCLQWCLVLSLEYGLPLFFDEILVISASITKKRLLLPGAFVRVCGLFACGVEATCLEG
jgi:hypothetical protein